MVSHNLVSDVFFERLDWRDTWGRSRGKRSKFQVSSFIFSSSTHEGKGGGAGSFALISS
jgi:hypothetical protein